MAAVRVQNSRRMWIIAGAVALLAFGAFALWRYLSPRESTDDAQVSGHVNPVAARVGGTVLTLHVTDNQMIKAGDVLVEIDPRDYQLAVQRAEADLAAAQAGARAARSGVPVTSATARGEQDVAQISASNSEAALQAADRDIDAARAKAAAARARLAEATATATRASQDLERLKPLMAKDEIPKQQYDAAVAADQVASAAVDSARAAVSEADANLEVSQAHRTQAAGGVQQAQAQARAAGTAPQQIAMTEARAATADAQVLQAQAALDQAQAQSRADDRSRGRRWRGEPPRRGGRANRPARAAVDGDHVARRSLGHGKFQGDAAAGDEARSACGNRSRRVRRPPSPATSRASRRRPARHSVCCRLTTPAATT